MVSLDLLPASFCAMIKQLPRIEWEKGSYTPDVNILLPEFAAGTCVASAQDFFVVPKSSTSVPIEVMVLPTIALFQSQHTNIAKWKAAAKVLTFRIAIFASTA